MRRNEQSKWKKYWGERLYREMGEGRKKRKGKVGTARKRRGERW